MSLSSSPVGGAGPRSTTGETLFRFLRRRLPTVFLLVLLILVLGGSSGRATTVVKMTFSEVVDGAELIVIGTVSAIEETWDAARGTPFTDVTFSDIEVLKGTARAGGVDASIPGRSCAKWADACGQRHAAIRDERADGGVFCRKRSIRVPTRWLVAGPLPGCPR